MATIGIPPAITEETKPFWDAAAEGRLLVERCDACGAESFPPRGICRTCRSRSMGWAEVTGPGVVYSYTVNHQAWLPGLEVPYAVALVEFPDHPGVRVAGRLRSPDGGAFYDAVLDVYNSVIEAVVEVGFEPGPDGVAVPSFRLVLP